VLRALARIGTGVKQMEPEIRLNNDDITYLLTLLRNANQPLSTQQLIDAMRRQSAPPTAKA